MILAKSSIIPQVVRKVQIKEDNCYKMFEINTSKKKFEQLKENILKLRKNPVDVSLAEKICEDTWHLCDWVFAELQEQDSQTTKEQFRIEIYNSCPEFRTLHDIANTIKHKKLDRPKINIKSTFKHHGTFDYTFDNTFETSYLEIEYQNGTKKRLIEILQPALDYWESRIN